MKHILYNSIILLCSLFMLTSCGKLFIKPDPSGDAERSFEIFWSDIYNSYPFFDYDKVDWNATYKQYKPRVNSSTSNDSMFVIFQDMLQPMLDGHISVTNTNGDV